jgi:hypothetical protein
MKTPNALGVKRRLAATVTHIDTPPPTARCPLQLLVGRTAYRCGLPRSAQPYAMEFTWRRPHVIRPVPGLAGPTPEGGRAGPAPWLPWSTTPPSVCPVPRPPPGTLRPWQPSPVVQLSCRALLREHAGRSTPTRDDARAHEHLPAGRTPLWMGIPTLGTHRLPVQTHRHDHRRLPERRTAQRQGLGLERMVEPVRPDDPCLRYRDMLQPPLKKIGDGQGHPLGCGLPSVCLLRARTIAEGCRSQTDGF